jgi:gliding motility-associated protein GldE
MVIAAIFSASEFAYFMLSPEEKKNLEAMHTKRADKILRLLVNPERLIATHIVSNLILSFFIISVSAFLLNQITMFSLGKFTGILLQLLTISVVVLLTGKILPKLIAQKNTLRVITFSIQIVAFAQKVLSPLVFLFIRFNSLINHQILPNRNNLSIDELSDALEQSDDGETQDRKLLLGIVNFSIIEVSEVMKPRIDVVSVDIETDFDELIRIINDSGYSRIPVFSETFDSINGILYVKDLLPFLNEGKNFKWQELIRSSYYVPETKKIKDLLQEFLHKKIHMAIVVDEYGGTEGIITLEDVLEEIVGEITDESDEIESYYSRIDDYNYIFDGKILLNDFYKIVQLSEELFEPLRGDADTLAGLVLEIKGEIPLANETISLKNFRFTILSVDNRRIRKVKFTLEKNLKIR